MKLAARIQNTETSPTIAFFEKTKKMISAGADIINLIPGEPDFPTPDNIKNAAKEALDLNITKYTVNKGTPELREAISEKLKKENGIDYSAEEIIVSNGAKQSVYNALQTLVSDDDEVIIPAPYYVSYPHMVNMAGGKPVIINTSEEENFKLSAAQLEENISENTKAVILCNPCNPTGTGYTSNELRDLFQPFMDREFFIIVDEVYEKLVYENFEFTSLAKACSDLRERIITVNGLSKTYSMTGWRIGYAAGDIKIVNAMNKVQSHATSAANSIAQYAGTEALRGSQEPVELMRKEFETRVNFMHMFLTGLEGVTCFKPNGALYLFPNVAGIVNKMKLNSSTDLANYLLENAGIAVVPGSGFGAEGFIRLSITSSIEKLEKVAARLNSVLK